jgi:LPS export ABC transporter protein LptC
MRWQRRARWGLAAFGIAFAFFVYTAIGQRPTAAPSAAPARLDPKAILESVGAAFQQFQAARQDYVIEADRQLTYEGGATKFINVTIRVKQREGRDFVISGREAQAGENQKDLEVRGDVKLAASDGFVATTDHATFNQDDATVRVAGPVSFQKGRMSGSGLGMTYNQMTDVLALAQQARVLVVDGAGKSVNEFRSGSATLARLENYLALEGDVHALRGDQVLDADQGRALLSEDDEHVTFIELRGESQVTGGSTFESMTARDIDLDYTDDGTALERAQLTGSGVIKMAGGEEGPGRQFAGDVLELTFAPDASLTQAVGRGGVRVDLPAATGTPARSVRSQTFEATGTAGEDLDAARFDGEVEYREDAAGGRAARVARSHALRIALAGDAVTSATFTGSVKFEDQGLEASAALGNYDPARGTLRLSGADAGGAPRVADAQIEIQGEAIDVTLQGRRMAARGNVRTILRAGTAKNRLPGLLQQGQPANVNADVLEYDGDAGKATYTGAAALWQGETAIRANAIALDQTRGDLVATGTARSTVALDAGTSVGSANEIRYGDAGRTLTYDSPPPPKPAPTTVSPIAPTSNGVAPTPISPVAPTPSPLAPTPVSPVAPTSVSPLAPTPVSVLPPSRMSGVQGDVSATRIELVLAAKGAQLERLEAYGNVTVRVDTRVGTGDRLTYFAEDGRYLMTGIATVPVKIVEECRETSGRTVTFFKSTERIIVDGNEEVRTQSKRGGPCPAPPAR